MPLIIKSFLGVFFFILVVFLGIGMIQYQTDVNRAVYYKQDMMEELQNSNFAPSVINACIAAGKENHYEDSIDVSLKDGSQNTYTSECMAAKALDVTSAYVTVTYKSRLPFLGLETSNCLRGFAR